MQNPYQGHNSYQYAWAHGFDYGRDNPDNGDPEPPDFSSWVFDDQVAEGCRNVWLEGAAAGRSLSRQRR